MILSERLHPTLKMEAERMELGETVSEMISSVESCGKLLRAPVVVRGRLEG